MLTIEVPLFMPSTVMSSPVVGRGGVKDPVSWVGVLCTPYVYGTASACGAIV